MKPEVHKLRVNVKSLAAEARFIRQEIRRTRNAEAKSQLAVHRAMRVKPEARLAHLALAFVRGVPYRVAESYAEKSPTANELAKKLGRFMFGVNEADVDKWLKTA